MHYNLQENVVEQKMITNDFESTMYMPVLKLIVGFRLLNRSLLFKTARAAHCLVTKSKQPTMNENSKIISKADLTTDSLDLETIPNLSSKTDPHRILSRIVVFIYEDVIKYISPVYHASRSTPDGLEHFKEEFGYFYGKCLYTQVTQLCQQPRSTTQPA
ncbi:unnamed protein product [Adineta steineri]|uniref:Uncharacterized protein n=1 Tax=Adineta steineri TaxID=433720 RepID=A0A813NE76_9BILA|nr:unnamed protein product [Adineta steineri]